jgi:hypothetical protein
MSDDEYDNILFDRTNGIEIIELIRDRPNCNFKGPIDKFFIFAVHRDTPDYDSLAGRYQRNNTYVVFKKFIIVIVPNEPDGIAQTENYSTIMHNLPNNILFVLKTIKYDSINDNGLNINQLITFYDTNTNYFKSNSDIYYDKLKQEMINYEKEQKGILIKEKQTELDKLILDNQQKIDYYNNLEQQIIDVNKEKEIIKENQTKLDKLILDNQQKIDYYKSLEQQIIDVNKEKEIIKEEKRKIIIVKEKMAQQKRNFDEEKCKFELEKDRINEIDVDNFINSVLETSKLYLS